MSTIRDRTFDGSGTSRLAAGFAIGLGLLVVGAAVGRSPALAPPLIVLIAVSLVLALRGHSAWWDMFALVVFGLYVLDVGFSNIGLPGGLPIPLADVVAIVLLARAATRVGFRLPTSLPFLFGAGYVTVVALRLLVDLPRFGVLAMRDASLAIEISFLFIGYWIVREYGLPRLARLLSFTFLVGTVYWAFHPLWGSIAAASPVVGIQRPVPLLGVSASGVVVPAAFFFFALVRPFGRWSYLVAATTLPIMALQQSRALYLALPTAIICVWVGSRAHSTVRVRRGLAITLTVGAVAMLLFFPFAPEGRVGKTTPSLIVAQLGTLAGHKGPGSPVDQRKEWVAKTFQKVSDTPYGWLVGVGLGPDLAFGFENEAGVLVRKPHNDYLEAYARLGVLGFAFLAGMIGVAFARVFGGARRATGLEGAFLWFAVAQTIVLATAAATQPFLAYPYGSAPLLIVLGAALAVCERPRKA
jgi:O-antigen ligase